jgi:hypothetical protein
MVNFIAVGEIHLHSVPLPLTLLLPRRHPANGRGTAEIVRQDSPCHASNLCAEIRLKTVSEGDREF